MKQMTDHVEKFVIILLLLQYVEPKEKKVEKLWRMRKSSLWSSKISNLMRLYFNEVLIHLFMF